MEIAILGERGQITIPNSFRKKFNLKPKQPVLIDEIDGRLVIIPAVVIPREKIKEIAREFTEKEIEEFLKNNEISDEEFEELKKILENV